MALHGILVPPVTPFTETLAIDARKLTHFCHELLAGGACGLVVFGTTGEANSLSIAERMEALDALIAGGVPAERLLVGAGACALDDVVRVGRHALDHGCAGLLCLPPFYYKNVSDDGVFDFFDAMIARVSVARRWLYLYHIPPVAQVGFSFALIERLCAAHGAVVAGIKDSSGDVARGLELLRTFDHLAIYPGKETYLRQALELGAAGCITACANVNLEAVVRAFTSYADSEGAQRQEEVTAFRARLEQSGPVIPVLKALRGVRSGDDGWRRVRPPLRALSCEAAATLESAA